jgi:hypothetical protein
MGGSLFQGERENGHLGFFETPYHFLWICLWKKSTIDKGKSFDYPQKYPMILPLLSHDYPLLIPK